MRLSARSQLMGTVDDMKENGFKAEITITLDGQEAPFRRRATGMRPGSNRYHALAQGFGAGRGTALKTGGSSRSASAIRVPCHVSRLPSTR